MLVPLQSVKTLLAGVLVVLWTSALPSLSQVSVDPIAPVQVTQGKVVETTVAFRFHEKVKSGAWLAGLGDPGFAEFD